MAGREWLSALIYSMHKAHHMRCRHQHLNTLTHVVKYFDACVTCSTWSCGDCVPVLLRDFLLLSSQAARRSKAEEREGWRGKQQQGKQKKILGGSLSGFLDERQGWMCTTSCQRDVTEITDKLTRYGREIQFCVVSQPVDSKAQGTEIDKTRGNEISQQLHNKVSQ